MMRLLVRALLVALLLQAFAPGAAWARSPRMKAAARRHLVRGMTHYQQHRFDKAIKELKKGQRLDPRPEFLYALGQAHRASGRCAQAIRYYESFLETGPPAQQAEAARSNIARCRGGPPAPAPAPAPPDAPAAPEPAEATPGPAAEPTVVVLRRPWFRDWIGHSLVAGGVATLVVGVVVWQLGRSAIDRAWAATTYDGYAAHAGELSSAAAKQRAGVGVMSVGGALVVGGVLHYVLRRRTETRTAFGLSAGRRSALLTAAGRF